MRENDETTACRGLTSLTLTYTTPWQWFNLHLSAMRSLIYRSETCKMRRFRCGIRRDPRLVSQFIAVVIKKSQSTFAMFTLTRVNIRQGVTSCSVCLHCRGHYIHWIATTPCVFQHPVNYWRTGLLWKTAGWLCARYPSWLERRSIVSVKSLNVTNTAFDWSMWHVTYM